MSGDHKPDRYPLMLPQKMQLLACDKCDLGGSERLTIDAAALGPIIKFF